MAGREGWGLEEWAQSNEPFSGGGLGLKWYEWMGNNFPYGFVAIRVDTPPWTFPWLGVPMEHLTHVGVHGMNMMLRFHEILPYKTFFWEVMSIIDNEDGSKTLKVENVPNGEPQQWRLVQITEEQWRAWHERGGS